MADSSSHPVDGWLRPAQGGDRSTLHTLMTRFEQELRGRRGTYPRWKGVLLGVVLALLLYWAIANTLLLVLLNYAAQLAIFVLVGWIARQWLQRDTWKHYWVMEQNHEVIACVRLQNYTHHSVLQDVYVLPGWRGRGIGTQMVRAIAQKATLPLYLLCYPERHAFYHRLGFHPMAIDKLPPIVRYDLGLVQRSPLIVMALLPSP